MDKEKESKTQVLVSEKTKDTEPTNTSEVKKADTAEVEVKKEVKKVGEVDSPQKVREGLRVRSVRKGRERKKRSRRGPQREDDGYDSTIISIRRVTKVHKGGKRMRLSAVIVVGDKKGSVGIGVGKGSDVRNAEEKAFAYAKKHLYSVPLKGDTIPHEINHKKGAARIFLKPAAPGTGIIAGSAVRAVVELAGIKDILTKVLGSRNSINNAYATLEALTQLRKVRL